MKNKELLSLHPGGLRLTEYVAEKACIEKGSRFLDIGCATGSSLIMLRDRFGIIPFGIDSSAKAMSYYAEQAEGLRLAMCDACSLPYEDDFFNTVMMECVITLLDDPEGALKEAVRVLCSGGKLIISALADTGHSDSQSTVCRNGLLDISMLKKVLSFYRCRLLFEEDRREDLIMYLAESIFEYGSLKARIAAETQCTGASVFSCDPSVESADISYHLSVFIKE